MAWTKDSLTLVSARDEIVEDLSVNVQRWRDARPFDRLRAIGCGIEFARASHIARFGLSGVSGVSGSAPRKAN